MKNKIIFIVIIIVAAILRFWSITFFDLYTDNALYSFRALGWLDFLGGGQTTPIQWFKTLPWWSNLSFHDAPPLGFLIQHVFFVIFGDNTLAARLPYVLAGLASVALVFYLVKRFKNERAALLAAGLLAISSYAIWSSLAGYLEGLEVFFIIGSLYFLVAFLSQQSNRRLLYGWAVFIGLALLTKYTALFLLPAAVLTWVLGYWTNSVEIATERNQTKIKPLIGLHHYLYVFLIILLILMPVIVYNSYVFSSRGHFDAALSSMAGMHPTDFSIIASRSTSFQPLLNLYSIWYSLAQTNSWPYLVIFLLALIWFIVKVSRRKANWLEITILANTLLLIIEFTFIPAAERLFSIITPLLAITVALFVYDLWVIALAEKSYHYLRYLTIGLISIVMVGELFYSVNSNVLAAPINWPVGWYSPVRFYDRGWNKLDNYWRKNLLPASFDQQPISNLADLTLTDQDFSGRNIIFFDDRVDWFAYTWYIQRYTVFYKIPLLPATLLLQGRDKTTEFLTKLREVGAQNFYFVATTNDEVRDSVKKQDITLQQALESFILYLDGAKAEIGVINNSQAESAFKVYQLR